MNTAYVGCLLSVLISHFQLNTFATDVDNTHDGRESGLVGKIKVEMPQVRKQNYQMGCLTLQHIKQ